MKKLEAKLVHLRLLRPSKPTLGPTSLYVVEDLFITRDASCGISESNASTGLVLAARETTHDKAWPKGERKNTNIFVTSSQYSMKFAVCASLPVR